MERFQPRIQTQEPKGESCENKQQQHVTGYQSRDILSDRLLRFHCETVLVFAAETVGALTLQNDCGGAIGVDIFVVTGAAVHELSG